MFSGTRRAALVWHRRSGKDLTTLNWTIWSMFQRPGTYYYFLPTYTQAKRIIWDGIDRDGTPFLAHFPAGSVIAKNETELKIVLDIGEGRHSVFQLVGSDNIDGIVGTNPIGCVFSEYAIQNPKGWDLVRPILAENGGWAVFVYTPRGKNHGHRLLTAALAEPTWYTSILTVDQTRRDGPGEDGTPVVLRSDIEEERRLGMPEELIQQEFYCSFEGAMVGAYYADQLKAAREEGRIGSWPYQPGLVVDTAWDLGVDDATAIGFTQTVQGVCRWIDYLEESGKGLDYYWGELKRKPYIYGQHYGPFDLGVREFVSGNTRLEIAARMGLHFTVVPKLSLADGIAAVRRILPVSQFNERTCEKLIDKLASYRRDFDEKTQTWRQVPLHDWTSHTADMVRYRAIGWFDPGSSSAVARQEYAEGQTWDAWAHERPQKSEVSWHRDPWETLAVERESRAYSDWSPFTR